MCIDIYLWACMTWWIRSNVKKHDEARKAKPSAVRKCQVLSITVQCNISSTTSVECGQDDISFHCSSPALLRAEQEPCGEGVAFP